MTNKTKLIAIMSMLAFVGAAQAELRVWTDESGTTIEAEHVRTLTDKVVLRQPDGTEITVSLKTLSERDRRYAILQAPPRIDINVSSDADRSNTGYSGRRSVQVQEETVSVDFKMRKSSSAPYAAPLRAEIYLIGSPENKEGFVILDKRSERFSFSAENNNEHVITSRDVKLKQLEAGREMGVEYNGYLIAVIDPAGKVLALKCSKLAYEKNADTIRAGEKGSMYDGDFKELDKKPASQADQRNKKKRLPGRRF